MTAALQRAEAAGVDAQLQALIAEHQKDYSRQDTLQQIIALGMAHKRYDLVEEYLISFTQMGMRTAPLYYLIATIQEKKQDHTSAAATLRDAFRAEGPKTEEMYEAAGRILPRTLTMEYLELSRGLLETGAREYPSNTRILLSLVEIYRMLGRHDKAISLCDRAIQRMPFDDQLYFTKALLRMVTSNLAEGFDDYKHRFRLPLFKNDTPFLPWQEWQGETLAGKKLYLWAEQGVGDLVMWSGLFPWLQRQDAAITCAAPAKILTLFRRSFPGIRFVEKELVLPKETLLAEFDFHCPMGDLMRYALPHYKPSAHAASHLIPDREAVARKRSEYLAHNSGAKKLVGISWYSAAPAGWRRNIPLESFRPLLQEPDTLYVSLQYNQQLGDVDNYNKQATHPLIADLSFIAVDDMDAWATQHAAMDEIVSIQNSSVHLAGALGVPATIFLGASGSFHWGDGSSPNPWYRSVTLCQQKPGQSWEALIHAYRQRKGR